MLEAFMKVTERGDFLLLLTGIMLGICVMVVFRVFLPKAQKIKVGPIEFQAKEEEEEEEEEEEVADMKRDIFAVLDSIESKIDTIDKRVNILDRDQNRLTHYADMVPVEQRMIAGLRYIEAGGNGYCKKDVLSFIHENPSVYNVVTSLAPNLALPNIGGADVHED